jgi:hypothetical protein
LNTAPAIGGGGTRSGPGFAAQRCRDIDRADARMRVRAAHEGRVQHAGELDVVDEERASGEQAGVLVAWDRFAEEAGGHLETESTASTMFW